MFCGGRRWAGSSVRIRRVWVKTTARRRGAPPPAVAGPSGRCQAVALWPCPAGRRSLARVRTCGCPHSEAPWGGHVGESGACSLHAACLPWAGETLCVAQGQGFRGAWGVPKERGGRVPLACLPSAGTWCVETGCRRVRQGRAGASAGEVGEHGKVVYPETRAYGGTAAHRAEPGSGWREMSHGLLPVERCLQVSGL